jgi:hypothetical protein
MGVSRSSIFKLARTRRGGYWVSQRDKPLNRRVLSPGIKSFFKKPEKGPAHAGLSLAPPKKDVNAEAAPRWVDEEKQLK